MNNLKQTLTHPIPHTPLKLWHILAGMALLWLLPVFIPFDMFQAYVYIFIVVWIAAYVLLNRLIKHTIRVSGTDIILIERVFILLTWIVPAIISTIFGLQHDFDTLNTVLCVFLWVVSALLIFGIIIHIKKAPEYYHGVKKSDLFE